jgi:hypothetical protein
MRFTVFLTTDGALATGLTPIISIWRNTPDGDVSHPVLFTDGLTFTEMGEGLYYYDYAAASVDNDYSAIADSTLPGGQKYAPCIGTVQGDIELIRAIEAGRWEIDISAPQHKMVFYNEAGDEVKSFDLEEAVTPIPQYVQRTKTI